MTIPITGTRFYVEHVLRILRTSLSLIIALVIVGTPLIAAPADAGIAPTVQPRAQAEVGARGAAGAGPRYWRLNDLCRGESDPAIYRPACAKRDAMMKGLGRGVIGRFVTAWRREDRPAMRRLIRGWGVPGSRATSRAPRCFYDPNEPDWHCVVRTKDYGTMILVARVVRFQAPRVPLWRVTSVVPDF